MKLTKEQIDSLKDAIYSLEEAADKYPDSEEAHKDGQELINIIKLVDDYITERE